MTDQASIPGATPRIAVVDLESGQAVDSVYACSELTTATDRNGKAYLRLKLRDASGEVAAIHFDPSDDALGLSAGDVVCVGGTYSVHPQYGAQIQVRRLRAAEDAEYEAGDLVQVSPVGTAELAERLHALIDSVEKPYVRALLERAFDGSREPGATFAIAPAAVRNHHAYRHGLLEHSLIVAEAAGGRGVAVRLRRPRPRRRRRPAARHRQDPCVHQRRHGPADDRRGPPARRDRHGPRHGPRSHRGGRRTSRPRPPSCSATSSSRTTACARRAARWCRRPGRRSSSTTATT